MYTLFTKRFLPVLFIVAITSSTSFAQNSILVNLGTPNCSNTAATPIFSLIGNPLSQPPNTFTLCDLSKQLPNYMSVFVAYNPKDNKIYVIDDRDANNFKVWILDIGLPGNIACPVISDTPTYVLHNYTTSYFEFDNNGDLWSLSNYNVAAGTCNLDRFDVTTGNVLSTKTLQFPQGNFPNNFGNGDITILPNGRLFVVLGTDPSQLYEITNYGNEPGDAEVTYLQSMPQNTYGLAYLNGLLEVTGTDENGICYYYTYDISADTLSQAQPFQNGQLPIDNTSITPAIGTTKQVANISFPTTTEADVTYEVYVRNMGNVMLNNVNASDNLGAINGAANVSNVSVNFEQGGNNAGLALNPNYNGTTDTNILAPGQNLPNEILGDSNYFFKVLITCRISNIYSDITYYNSAIGNATIGNGFSAANVSDSSNNGPSTVFDPNNNGDASDPGENVPTPFHYFSPTPVNFISVGASLENSSTSIIKWSVATPTINAAKFAIEYSTDGSNWKSLAQVNVVNASQGNYQFQQQNIPSGNIYYRIREIDYNGVYTMSKIVLLNNKDENGYVVFPNPAGKFLQISTPYGFTGKASLELFDATGRKLIENTITNTLTEINTSHLPNGTYMLRIKHNEDITTQKVLIVH